MTLSWWQIDKDTIKQNNYINQEKPLIVNIRNVQWWAKEATQDVLHIGDVKIKQVRIIHLLLQYNNRKSVGKCDTKIWIHNGIAKRNFPVYPSHEDGDHGSLRLPVRTTISLVLRFIETKPLDMQLSIFYLLIYPSICHLRKDVSLIMCPRYFKKI